MSSSKPSKNFRLPVLDFLRGIAITCVVIDHTLGWLGLQDQWSTFHHYTIFSVAPLFFLAGITYGLSFLRRQPVFAPPAFTTSPGWRRLFITISNYLRFFWRKSQKIITAYIIGTLVILLWQTRTFSLAQFWTNLITFPFQFYFIAIYLQLLLVAPLVLLFWQKINHFSQTHSWTKNVPYFMAVFGLPLLLIFSLLCSQILVLPPPIWLPAQQLFGGIELFLFGSGTLIACLYFHNQFQLTHLRKQFLGFFGALGLLFIIFTDKQALIFAHPPKFWTIFYAASGLSFLTCFYSFISHLHVPKFLRPSTLTTFFGRHSLDIYIYHSLFISQFLLYYPRLQNWPLIWQLLFLVFAASFASIFLTWLINQLFFYLKKITSLLSSFFSSESL